MDDGRQRDEPTSPAGGADGPPRAGDGDAGRAAEPDGAPSTAADEEEVPTLRDEIRTAAQYGVAGRWATRRREKIRAEIERNRRGEYKVPTWVLGLILAVVVVGWVLLIVLA